MGDRRGKKKSKTAAGDERQNVVVQGPQVQGPQAEQLCQVIARIVRRIMAEQSNGA